MERGYLEPEGHAVTEGVGRRGVGPSRAQESPQVEVGQGIESWPGVEKTVIERKPAAISVAREAERPECSVEEGGSGQLGCLSHAEVTRQET